MHAEALGGGREVGGGGSLGVRGKELGRGLSVALCLDSKTVTVCFVITLGGIGLGFPRGGGVDRPLWALQCPVTLGTFNRLRERARGGGWGSERRG